MSSSNLSGEERMPPEQLWSPWQHFWKIVSARDREWGGMGGLRQAGPQKGRFLVLSRDSDAGASSLEIRRKSNLPEHPTVSKMLPCL